MDYNIFVKYIRNLGNFSINDIKDMEFMTEKEINEYQDDLETNDGFNLSPWEHIRAIITLKKEIDESKTNRCL